MMAILAGKLANGTPYVVFVVCFLLAIQYSRRLGENNLWRGPILAVLIHSLLRAPAKIGPDTNSHNIVLFSARFWLQRWLAVRTMPQDLIGCWNQRKLKALIPRVVVFANDQPSAERRIDFAVFFIVLWSYGRKICLNMYHGNSENSYGCSYLLWICFIYGTNVSVSRSWIPRQVELLTANKMPFDLPTNECKSKYYPS